MSVFPEAVAICGCLTAGVIDARTGYIPDRVSGGAAVIAFGCAIAHGTSFFALVGGITIGTVMTLLYSITRGEGLGLGDVKLGIAIGVGFGAAAGILAIGTAFVLGGAYAVWLLATDRAQRRDGVRFGPFLAAGTLLAALALAHPGPLLLHAAAFASAP